MKMSLNNMCEIWELNSHYCAFPQPFSPETNCLLPSARTAASSEVAVGLKIATIRIDVAASLDISTHFYRYTQHNIFMKSL